MEDGRRRPSAPPFPLTFYVLRITHHVNPTDIQVVHNVPHAAAWGLPIAQYFYFTGLSAGTFVISTLGTVFGIEKYKAIAKYAASLAFILLIAAPTCLMLDLEQPLRFWHLFVWFNPKSVISWGVWLLTIYPLACLVYAFLLFKGDARMAKIMGIVGVPLALCVHGYTGFIFGVVKARAFWYSPLMPPYFLVSAFISGFGLMILFVMAKDRLLPDEPSGEDVMWGLAGYLRWAIVVGLLFTFCNVLVLAAGGEDAALSVGVALRDPLFIVGDLLLGYVLPLAVLCLPWTRRSPRWLAVAAVMTLVGVFWMRYTLVEIGQLIPLS